MGNLHRIVHVDLSIESDKLKLLKSNGASVIESTVELQVGIIDNAGLIYQLGKDIQTAGMTWDILFDVRGILQQVLAETGPDNRMFVRKAERTIFENAHKLLSKLKEANYAPKYVSFETEIFDTIPSITLNYEEKARIINGIINAAKSGIPDCKLIVISHETTDNEAAKKQISKIKVASGRAFEAVNLISIKYDMDVEKFYDLNLNMNDLSRRFEAGIILDISDLLSESESDLSLSDLDLTLGAISLERGYGVIYSEELVGKTKIK